MIVALSMTNIQKLLLRARIRVIRKISWDQGHRRKDHISGAQFLKIRNTRAAGRYLQQNIKNGFEGEPIGL